MKNPEGAICTWAEIHKLYPMISMSSLLRMRHELFEAGAVFHQRVGRRRQKLVCAFPSRFITYMTLAARKKHLIEEAQKKSRL